MTRHKWWIAGGVGVAFVLIAVAVGTFALSNRPGSDCVVARSMIDYNKQFDKEVRANDDSGVETSVSDYERWASELKRFADQVHDDPSLTEHADDLANLADQTAALLPQARAELSTKSARDTQLPQSARDYSRISKEFDDNLVALDDACPT